MSQAFVPASEPRSLLMSSQGFSYMVEFAIIELEDGFTIVEVQSGQKPEDAAANHGGILVDPGPYASYEEANDALIDLQAADDEERA